MMGNGKAGRYARMFGLLTTLIMVACGSSLASHPRSAVGSSLPEQGSGEAVAPADEKVAMDSTQDKTGAKVPADFSIELSSGGGFAGTWQGTRVTADGKVIHWKTGPNASKRTEEVLGSLEPAAVLRLVETLRNSAFFDTKLDQPGNMTVVLAANLGGKSHKVRYPLPMDQHPEAVRSVVDAFRAEIRPLEQARAAQQ